MTDNVTYPSGDENIKYIKEVALFNGTSFESACNNARNAGYIPVTRAFSDGYNYADLNSNDRETIKFTGNGSQYECIAYKQTTNPNEAITDLRVFVSTDEEYSRTNQTKEYTLNSKKSEYTIVSGCNGNVNYGVTSNTSSAFLYYTTDKNAGSPLTELIVELQESSFVDAYRLMDHRSLQIGNFVETFGTNDVSSFSNVRIANFNLGSTRDVVIGDSVYLFLKRYDGCSGYNTKTSYEVVTGVPETIYLNSSATNFQSYVNNTVDGNGIVTFSNSTASTGKLYFHCPDATSVTVTATSGAGENAVTLSSSSLGSGAGMTKQSNGVFYKEVTSGAVSGLASGSSGVIKWVFSYTVTGSSTTKTQIAYSTVATSMPSNAESVDKSALRNFISNFNQSTFVKDSTTTYNGDNSFADALANASYVLGNPSSTQDELAQAKATFAICADKTSVLYVPDTPDENVETLLDECGGYIYGICQPEQNYDELSDIGFNWVRFDIPCPFNSKGGITQRYKDFKARCQAYHEKGLKILAVTPYPKDLLWDMGIQYPPFTALDDDEFDSFIETAKDVAEYIYNDVRDDGKGGSYVDALQITNEMGISNFTQPLTIEQAATYIGVQLQVIDGIRGANDKIQIGYNCADLPLTTKYLHELLNPYLQYCDYVAIDLYTGNQGEATAKNYVKKVKDLYSITNKPIIITEFGYWSEGGQKSAAEKNAILYNNYGYNTEEQAIADGQNFIDKLPDEFKETLQRECAGRESEWPSLVFSKFSNHFYGETSPYSINDIPHTPEGQGEYFKQVMTELKKVDCLAGMIIYSCKDKEVCFNCGHSWCPYETKFGIFNYDGTPKASVATIKETIATLKEADRKKAEEGASSTTYGENPQASVNVYCKNGSKALSCDAGEVYKGSTVVTSPMAIPGYTCTSGSTVFSNVSSDVSKTYNTYTPITYTATKNVNGASTNASFNIDGTALVLETPQRDGYSFVGWKVTSVAGGTLSKTNFIKDKIYAAGTYKGMYGNVTFEAQWQAKGYTVSFDVSNGGSVSTSSKTVVFGEAYGTLPEVTAPSGEIFAGWFTAKTGGSLVTADTIYNVAGNQTLYAHYGERYYDVGYDNLFLADKWNEGVNGAAERGTVAYNQTEKSIAFTSNSGSTDSYTSLDESKYSMPVEGGQTYVFTAEVTVSADAVARPLARALDSSNTSKEVKELGQISISAGSTYIYHKEWTVPSSATKVAIRFGTTTGGVTITYKNIRFVKKSVADQSISYPVNTDSYLNGVPYANLSEPTRAGYIFDGWYSDVGCTQGNEIDENDIASGHITVYSKWIKLNEVTYDNLFSITEYATTNSKNLSEISGVAQIDGEKASITVPGNPDSDGGSPYTSWSTSSGYYTIPVTAGTKYYISFYVNNWGGNVFVNFDNGTVSDTNMTKYSGTKYIGGVLSGNKAQKYTFYFKAPSGATKIGLRFGASGTEDRTYSNIKVIDESRYYSDAVYDSTFSYVPVNSTYGDMQTPTRKGYVFEGWYTESGTKITASSATGTAAVKLFSHWTKSYDIMYNSIFDFDTWGVDQIKSGTTYDTAVDFGANSYTFIAASNHSGEVTSTGNGPSAYRMHVVAGHKYRISADITADINNPDSRSYNLLVFEWAKTYSNSWDDYLSPVVDKTYPIDPGVTQTCTLEFTAKDDTDTISLRLALKSNGASIGTFSNIRIQDITATPYPESFVQVNASTTDSLMEQPDKTGYNSNGWYDTVSSDGTVSGTQYTSVSSLTGNKILYPKYTQKTYTVTYNSTIGTNQTVKTLNHGENPTTAYTPSAVGYRFVGWYTESGLRTYAPMTVTGNLTLYAKWEPIVYNIGFDNLFMLKAQDIANYEQKTDTVFETRTVDKDNGTVTMVYQKSGKGDDSERNLTSNFIELPSVAGDNTYYIISADVAATNCDARIMAFFYDKDGNQCSIWHTNDGTHPVVEKDGAPNNIDTPSYSSGTDAHHYYVVKVPSGCKKIKLRFDCLNVDATKKRTVVFSNIRVVEKTSSSYITATADYSKLESTVAYLSAYELPTISKPGYVFEGWYMDSACTVPANTSSCTTTSNHTLYSKWELDTLDITYDNLFDINDFVSNDSHLTKNGQVLTVNACKSDSDAYKIPVKGGEQYRFSYEQLGSTENNPGSVFIKFHKADGTIIDADQCERYTAEECLNYAYSNYSDLTENTGANAGSWSIPNYNEKNNVVTIIRSIGISQATPYNWTINGIVDSKRIIYNQVTNSDIGANIATNTFGAVNLRFYTPTDTAYITVDFGSESMTNIYFQNIKLQRLETYNVNDAQRTLSIATDAGNAKQKEGYTCNGWKIDGTEDFVTSNTYDLKEYIDGINLTSKWTPNNYNISYANMDGATYGANHPVNGTYDTAFAVSAPTKAGYRFKGWTVTTGLDTSSAKWGTTASPSTSVSSTSTKCFNEANDIYLLNLIKTSGGNVTLTANWEPNTVTINVMLDGKAWTECNKQQIQLYQNNGHRYTIYPTSDKSVFIGSGIAVGTYDIYAGSGIGGYADSGINVTVDATNGTGTATINYYNLTVSAGTGVSSTSGTGTYLSGTNVSVSATAKAGYGTPTFDTTLTNGKYTVTGTKKITATAGAISYTVSYANVEADNDQTPVTSSWPSGTTSFNVNSNTTIPSASATGYTFNGWRVVSDTQGSWTKDSTVNAGTSLNGKYGNVTLNPIWTANTGTAYKVEHYQMNIVDNGYTLYETENKTGTTDTTATASEKTYAGFTYDSSVAGTKTSGNIDGDGTLVLKLYYTRNSYDLTINSTGKGIASVSGAGTYKFDKAVTVSATLKAGYENLNWNNGNVTGNTIKIPASNTILTPTASLIDYTITFDANASGSVSGLPTSLKLSYNIESTDTLPTPARTGYSFDGWKVQTTSGNWTADTVISGGTAVTGKYGSVTLVAQWTIYNSSVVIVPNGGSITVNDTDTNTSSKKYSGDYNTTLSLSNPIKTGYHLTGWQFDAVKPNGSVSDTTYTFGSANGVTDTITAQWTANQYTVQFNLNYTGATGAPADQTGTYNTNSAFDAADPIRTGYSFGGWYTDSACTDKNKKTSIYNFTDENGATITLYAKWTFNTYYVEYDYNGATSGIRGTLDVNGKVKETYIYNSEYTSPNPERSGYKFIGWKPVNDDYVLLNGNEKFSNLTSVGNYCVQLYAFWMEDSVYQPSVPAGSDSEFTAEDILGSTEQTGWDTREIVGLSTTDNINGDFTSDLIKDKAVGSTGEYKKTVDGKYTLNISYEVVHDDENGSNYANVSSIKFEAEPTIGNTSCTIYVKVKSEYEYKYKNNNNNSLTQTFDSYVPVTFCPQTTMLFDENDAGSFSDGASTTDGCGSWRKNAAVDAVAGKSDKSSAYGYSEKYSTDTKYSGGYEEIVSVASGDSSWPSYSFEFIGTGYTIYSTCNDQSGLMTITTAYKIGEKWYSYVSPSNITYAEGTDDYNNQITANSILGINKAVNTYYSEGILYQSPVYTRNDLTYGTYRVTVSAVYNLSFDKTSSGENLNMGSSNVTYSTGDIVDLSNELGSDYSNCEYFCMDDGENSTSGLRVSDYDSTLAGARQLTTSEIIESSYNVSIDGFRIFNPAGDILSTGDVKNIYESDNELNPIYQNVRGLITNKSFTLGSDTGIYIAPYDGQDGEIKSKWTEYVKKGANYEVLLTDGAIAFTIPDYMSFSNDRVHISLRSPEGSKVTAIVNGKEIVVNSTTEQFYDITDCVKSENGTVSITSSGGMLGIGTIKTFSSFTPTATQEALDLSNEILTFIEENPMPEKSDVIFDVKLASETVQKTVLSDDITLREQDGSWTAEATLTADDLNAMLKSSGLDKDYTLSNNNPVTLTAFYDGTNWVAQSTEIKLNVRIDDLVFKVKFGELGMATVIVPKDKLTVTDNNGKLTAKAELTSAEVASLFRTVKSSGDYALSTSGSVTLTAERTDGEWKTAQTNIAVTRLGEKIEEETQKKTFGDIIRDFFMNIFRGIFGKLSITK